jgi:multidrug efflux pump subunit AcrA (membrane-fusion protein)
MLYQKVLSSLLMGSLMVFFGCGEKIEPGNTEAEVSVTVKASVAAAEITSRPFIYEAVGTVAPQTASTLSSKLMGTIDDVKVKVGEKVKKGDILVVIDERQVAAGLNQAEAGLSEARQGMDAAVSARNAAQSSADLAKATFERYERLLDEESVSKQEYDEVRARYQQAASNFEQTRSMVAAAKFRIRQAEAGLASAQVSRKDVVVRAPYDGMVTSKLVEVGDLASPGTPFLTLETTGVYEVRLILPEAYIDAIRESQQVGVRIPAIGNEAIDGTVVTIAPSADQGSRTFQVKVLLGEIKNIRSGMFARVTIPVGEAGSLVIPRTALVRQGQLTGIFMVDEEQIAHFRLIRTGRSVGEGVEVISGLKSGQRYVVAPPLDLVTGARVEVAS